mmetsp:Transcript_40095/g.107464  ORF Transcript_40095/g.107464 Transcript_40095/m.107464 type:complete len:348 (-) Transcript_40095:2166-3209(-)
MHLQLLALEGAELGVGAVEVPRGRRHLILVDVAAVGPALVLPHQAQSDVLPARRDLGADVPAVHGAAGPLVAVAVLGADAELLQAGALAQHLPHLRGGPAREKEDDVALVLGDVPQALEQVLLGQQRCRGRLCRSSLGVEDGPQQHVDVGHDEARDRGAVGAVHQLRLERARRHLAVRHLGDAHAAPRAQHILAQVRQQLAHALHVDERVHSPAQHGIGPALLHLQLVPVLLLVVGLQQQAVDGPRQVLVTPGVRPHRAGQHPGAPQELRHHEAAGAAAAAAVAVARPAQDELEGHQVEPVPHRRVHHDVGDGEEGSALGEAHLAHEERHEPRPDRVDLVHQRLDLA